MTSTLWQPCFLMVSLRLVYDSRWRYSARRPSYSCGSGVRNSFPSVANVSTGHESPARHDTECTKKSGYKKLTVKDLIRCSMLASNHGLDFMSVRVTASKAGLAIDSTGWTQGTEKLVAVATGRLSRATVSLLPEKYGVRDLDLRFCLLSREMTNRIEDIGQF